MDLGALIPIAGIFSGVAIMWICYKVLELRVVGHDRINRVDFQRRLPAHIRDQVILVLLAR